MRYSDIFLLCVMTGLLALGAVCLHADSRAVRSRPMQEEKAALVARLELTDLALFTDARYARHPSMADRHTPFQDGPMSMEHFPSGTVVPPPPHLRPQ